MKKIITPLILFALVISATYYVGVSNGRLNFDFFSKTSEFEAANSAASTKDLDYDGILNQDLMEDPEPLINVNEIVSGGPPKDGIPPIDDPKYVSVEEAEDFVNDATNGILVKVGSSAWFYPYNIMTWHEIVNDTLREVPLSITFCPLCGTGIVFERTIEDGTVLDFGTSGKLWQSNLVMYDRQTDSYWPQVTGVASVGKLTGTELKLYPSSLIDFASVKEQFPEAKVLSDDTGHFRNYQRNPYQGYDDNESVFFPVSNESDRLHPKQLVYTLSVDGEFKAYHYDNISEAGLNGVVRDNFNGHELDITVGEDGEINVFDKTDNKRVIGFIGMWFSHVAVHPDTPLWVSVDETE